VASLSAQAKAVPTTTMQPGIAYSFLQRHGAGCFYFLMTNACARFCSTRTLNVDEGVSRE